jgi:hypothetical protein
MYVVIENTPGYMPEDDDPPIFEDYADAVAYLKERVEEYLDLNADGAQYRVEEGWASQDNLSAVVIHDDSKIHDLGRWIQIVVDESEEGL